MPAGERGTLSMLEKAPPEAARNALPSSRQEIDAIQLNSLGKLIPRNRTTFAHRIASRLEEDFFGQPIRRKIRFATFAARWGLQRALARIKVRRPPRSALARPAEMLRVAVHGTGSLGDFCNHMMFIQEFNRKYGPMEIDFFCHPKKVDDAKFIFAQAHFVKNVISANYLRSLEANYDLIIRNHYLLDYLITDTSRLLQLNADLLNAIDTSKTRLEPYRFIFDSLPFLDGVFARSISWQGMNLADALGHVANVPVDRKTIPFLVPDVRAYDILDRCGLAHRPYITVHDGFDTSYIPLNNNVTKCWPLSHWNSLVALLKEKFSGLLIVQIGSTNSSRIDGVDVDLRNKTTLDEAAWILKQSSLHIDGESGLARLAHALHTKSVVLFGPTSVSFFGLDGNINLPPQKCGDCWWSTQSWLSECPRGLATPECMESITPASVAEHVEDYFDAQRPPRYHLENLSLYGDDTSERLAGILADLFRKLHLQPVPISQRTANPDSGISLDPSKQWEYLKAWEVVDAMSAELGRPLRIADVGGGRGALSPYLAAKGHDVEIFDMNYAWDSFGDPGIEHRFLKWSAKNGLRCSYGSLFNVPGQTGAYDIVLSVSVLEHAPYKPYAIKELLRLLRSGGKLFLSFDFTADSANLEDDLRIEIFTPGRLQAALASVGVPDVSVSPAQVQKSVERIRRDGVGGIPTGMTVASLVIDARR